LTRLQRRLSLFRGLNIVCLNAVAGSAAFERSTFDNEGMRHAPGPRGWNSLGFFGRGSAGSTVQFVQTVSRCFGPVASFRLLHKRIYVIDDADLVQELLVARQHEFRRDTGTTLGRELVGEGLLTREEPLHRERRRILQPAFHRDQIASYVEAMAAECNRLSNEWEQKDQFDIRTEMRRVTLAIVGLTLFGTDFRDGAERISAVLQRVLRKAAWLVPAASVFEPLVTTYRRMRPHGRSLFFSVERARLEEIVAPMIAKRRGTDQRDILSLILNQRDDTDAPLTAEDVKNELVTFVLAGYETTATALTWTWYLLAQHPSVAARMRNELGQVLAGRAPTLDDVPRLTYTTNVFKEAMRLYPPVLLFARRPKLRLKFVGYEKTRAESIFISPYVTQRNPRYFERPENFEPERWEKMDIPKFAYFPFGGGAKMCIGEPFARMEGLMVLATLAQKWRLERLNETPVGIGGGTVLNPDQPIVMRPIRITASANVNSSRTTASCV
jgi:cytochrome P450